MKKKIVYWVLFFHGFFIFLLLLTFNDASTNHKILKVQLLRLVDIVTILTING